MTTNIGTKGGRRIKVAINLTLDVDCDAWEMDYGTAVPAEVREDVQQYVRNVLQQCEAGRRWAWEVLA